MIAKGIAGKVGRSIMWPHGFDLGELHGVHVDAVCPAGQLEVVQLTGARRGRDG